MLEDHRWPGNVRELQNLLQRLVIVVRGDTIGVNDLPGQMITESVTAQQAILLPEEGTNFDEEVKQLEIALLESALKRAGEARLPPERC